MTSASRILISCLILIIPTISALAGKEHAITFDLTGPQQTAYFGKQAGSALTPEDSLIMSKLQFEGDSLKVLVVPVKWADRPATYGVATLDSFFFSRDVYPGGSVADYFDEVSYGQIVVTGTVINWFTAGAYSENFDFESLLPGLDDLVDFSQFDGNNDGSVDAVVFLRSGTGEEDSRDPNDIWSYAMLYSPLHGPGPYDGVRIDQWNTSPELRPLHDSTNPSALLGIDTLNSIRVFVHELSHNIGLPDLYDYDNKLDFATYNTPNDGNDHPVYDWDVMGYGGYGYFSIKSPTPSHWSGWSKMSLGWIEPIELVGAGTFTDLVCYNIETYPDSSLYRINLTSDGSEYFLLEYRNPRSTGRFDKTDSDFSSWFFTDLTIGPDTLDRGLLILHVDESVSGYWSNNGWPAFDHYHVQVEDIGYNAARSETFNPEGRVTDSAQWWYPWETRKGALFSNETAFQSEFSPTTVPNSDCYASGPTGVVVRVDSIVGERLYLYVENPLDFDIDNDLVVDEIDNCPLVYNPEQIDTDEDGIGDACETSCCIGSTGNVNGDELDAVTLTDVTLLVNHLFVTFAPLDCPEEANTSGDPEGVVSLTDLTMLVNFLFVTFDPVANCL